MLVSFQPAPCLPEGYFTHADIATYRRLVQQIPAGGSMVEIGSHLGKSLCSVADIIRDRFLKVACVDLWHDNWSPSGRSEHSGEAGSNRLERFRENCQKFELEPDILRGTSKEMAAKVEDGSLDLIFIDAGHTFDDVMADIAAWRPKLRPGGILCGHDYHHNNFDWVDVKRAVHTAFHVPEFIDLGVGGFIWQMPADAPPATA